MNILHIVQGLGFGGIENMALSMLKANVHQCFILSIEREPEQVFRAWPMLEKFRENLFFANKKKGFRPEVVAYIKKICKEKSISVIHTHLIGPLIYGSLATLTQKNIAHIHTEHDVLHLRERKDWVMQYVIFKFKSNIRWVAVSNYVLDGLQSFFPGMDVDLIYNAIDTMLFEPGDTVTARQHFNVPQTAVVIGSAGRLVAIKGQRFLIEAMQHLPAPYYLVIAGDGELYQALANQIQALKLGDRVILTGFVQNMPLFYQACDLFCLPSLDEGFPLALLEAQACDLPVVSSDVGGCAEAIAPDSGLLVPAEDPRAIAQACLQVNKKNTNPREFILQRFSFSVMMTSYTQLYSKAKI